MKKIITISREFGSGGRTIGKEVAKNLGYAYYDKELIEKITEESGLSKDFIEKNAEYSRTASRFSYAFVGRTVEGVSVEDYLWRKQREIILDIADKGDCVIVGRCADYILKDRGDVLNVFIHADLQKRCERVVKLYGETEKEPEKRVLEKDKKRAMNYKYYTDTKWGMAKNYHVSLDSGMLGLDKCQEVVEMLVDNL